MRLFKIKIFILLCAIIFSSCGITKRRYLQGFYIPVGKKQVAKKNKDLKKDILNPSYFASNDTITEKQLSSSPNIFKESINSAAASEKNIFFQENVAHENKAVRSFFTQRIKKISFPEAAKIAPDDSLVQKPLSLFWIVLVLVLILYLAVIIFAAESLLPLGHIIGLIFAGLLLLWLLRVF